MNDSTEDEPWLHPDLAERLLDGREITQHAQDSEGGTGSDPRITGLARLLAVADGTPAGRDDDERAALRAFAEEFAPAPAPDPMRSGAPGRGLRRAFRGSRTAKVVIGGAAAAFALGGVAIAAQVGALPHPFGAGSATSAPGSPAGTSTMSPGSAGAPGPQGTPGPAATTTGAGRQTPTASGHTTSAAGVPGLKGLCESYVKSVVQARKLDSSSQERLEQAAGGAGKVDAYCARLTGTSAGHGKSPTNKPSAAKPRATGAPASPSSAAGAPTAEAPDPRPSGHGRAAGRPAQGDGGPLVQVARP